VRTCFVLLKIVVGKYPYSPGHSCNIYTACHRDLWLKAKCSGRVWQGIGLSTEETTEQKNIYISRCGLITQHMNYDGNKIYAFQL